MFSLVSDFECSHCACTCASHSLNELQFNLVRTLRYVLYLSKEEGTYEESYFIPCVQEGLISRLTDSE